MPYSAAYRESHAEEIRSYKKAYWLKNKERLLAERKAAVALWTPEQIQAKKDYDAAYHEKNRSAHIAHMRKQYHAVPLEERAERSRRWYATLTPEQKQKRNQNIRDAAFRRKYGITVVEYDRIYQIQQGRCAICRKHSTEFNQRLHVDHCHESKMVRGLLCHNCNVTLGLVHDQPEILRQAAVYLEKE